MYGREPHFYAQLRGERGNLPNGGNTLPGRE